MYQKQFIKIKYCGFFMKKIYYLIFSKITAPLLCNHTNLTSVSGLIFWICSCTLWSFQQSTVHIIHNKSGERSSGFIPAIPSTTIMNILSFNNVYSKTADQEVITVQYTYITLYLYWTEKVHNVLYYLGFLELGTGTCKASASSMLR